MEADTLVQRRNRSEISVFVLVDAVICFSELCRCLEFRVYLFSTQISMVQGGNEAGWLVHRFHPYNKLQQDKFQWLTNKHKKRDKVHSLHNQCYMSKMNRNEKKIKR